MMEARGQKNKLKHWSGKGMGLLLCPIAFYISWCSISGVIFFSVSKLMELHGEGSTQTTTDETGAKIERDSFEPPIQDSV